jgi:fatty acid desaturase
MSIPATAARAMPHASSSARSRFALLHGSLALLLGRRGYLLFVVAPLFLGLVPAFFVRSICEHHATPAGDPWRRARTLDVAGPFELFWTQINYHLEHHLFPLVPVRRMRELRRALLPEYARRGLRPERSYLRTALQLLREKRHFIPRQE